MPSIDIEVNQKVKGNIQSDQDQDQDNRNPAEHDDDVGKAVKKRGGPSSPHQRGDSTPAVLGLCSTDQSRVATVQPSHGSE